MVPLATVYGRAVYGPPARLPDTHVETATASLSQTTDRLTGRYSRAQRLVAWYRPTTLIPDWVRKRGDR
jgi:hypothetical protein